MSDDIVVSPFLCHLCISFEGDIVLYNSMNCFDECISGRAVMSRYFDAFSLIITGLIYRKIKTGKSK